MTLNLKKQTSLPGIHQGTLSLASVAGKKVVRGISTWAKRLLKDCRRNHRIAMTLLERETFEVNKKPAEAHPPLPVSFL